MAYVRGNHPQYRRSIQPRGIGGTSRTNGVSHLELSGKKDEVVYLAADEIMTYGAVDSPPHFQALGGAVTVWFTLVNIALATNSDPNVQDDAWWVNETAVAPGSIIAGPVLNFSAVKIQFNEDASLYIAGR